MSRRTYGENAVKISVYIVLIAVLAALQSCQSSGQTVHPTDHQQVDWKPQTVLMLSQAESILGEKGHLSESSSFVENAILTYTSAYIADAVDKISGKTGTLYFMLEEYPDVEAAASSYRSILDANKAHAGVQILSDMGDEAYFHSDGNNFLFMLVRKKTVMIRLKVNKTTSFTSKEEFMRVSQSLTDSILVPEGQGATGN